MAEEEPTPTPDAPVDSTMYASQFFDPLIWGPLAQTEFEGRVIVAGSTAVMSDNSLVGVPGSTVRFPKWTNMDDIADIAEDEDIELDTLTQEASEAVIKEAAKGFSYSDKAMLVGLGDIETEGVRQFGTLAARKVDADLITTALATVVDGHKEVDGTAKRDSKPLEHTITGGAITWPGIVDALEKFGDEFEPSDFAGLYIRAEQRSQIMKDEVFIRASELDAAGAPGSMVRRGFIGEIGGLAVYVTNRLPLKQGLILRNNSLGLLYKRRPIIERDRDIVARKNITTINMHYATKRLNDKGVLALTIGDASGGSGGQG